MENNILIWINYIKCFQIKTKTFIQRYCSFESFIIPVYLSLKSFFKTECMINKIKLHKYLSTVTLLSVPSYCFCHSLTIFNENKHTCHKYNWNWYMGENPRFLYWHFVYFYPEKNKTLMEINNGKCRHPSSIWKYSRHPAQFFNINIQVLSCGLQCKITVDFLLLAVYWNLANLREHFKRIQISWDFFILFNKHCRNFEIFMNIT